MQEIARLLLQRNAVRVSLNPPFTWASGIKSPVYCDNRLMTGYVNDRQQIVKALVQTIQEKNWQPTVIAGTATAAISWAAFVAEAMNLPMVYVRPEPKKHGAKKQIEGFLEENSRVVIVEDLFSTGGSSLASAEALMQEGRSTVAGIISIMTWELPQAAARFEEKGFAHASLTSFSEIIPLAVENGSISEADQERILEFRKNSQEWAEQYF